MEKRTTMIDDIPSPAGIFPRALSSLRASICLVAVLAFAASACGSSGAPPSAPCEQSCEDGTALRAVREMMKLAFNLTLQGKPVGTYDVTGSCPVGGVVEISGDATSNSEQGATEVRLNYDFRACGYLQKQDVPNENYAMTLTGSIAQQGVIAVQPTATTALVMQSDSITLSGTVYDPPIDYQETECRLSVGQNGNQLSGFMCEREAGVDL